MADPFGQVAVRRDDPGAMVAQAVTEDAPQASLGQRQTD
jgi:hypothetical protein